MPEDYLDQPLSRPIGHASRPRTGRRILIGLLLLLLAGTGLVAWLAWRGTIDLAGLSGQRQSAAPARLSQPAATHTPGAAVAQPQAAPAPAPPLPAALPGTAETRLALLEERLSRIDLRAEAASGNAARAEGLLVAFAARRVIDRGAPLGYLEDQLRLRFADAQPNAVQAIVDSTANPVTLDTLLASLDTFGEAMAGAASSEDTWTKMRREVSGLFVIRHEKVPSIRPHDRLQRAKLMLSVGKVADAIEEVRHLPGAEGARNWIASAQRYEAVQRALDLIETTAMLDERRLQDSVGNKVDQPSPLTEPARPTGSAI